MRTEKRKLRSCFHPTNTNDYVSKVPLDVNVAQVLVFFPFSRINTCVRVTCVRTTTSRPKHAHVLLSIATYKCFLLAENRATTR